MAIAKDILNDEEIINIYNEIDKVNDVPFNHGYKHVKNVYSIMEKICDVFKIAGLEKEALLISAALHDVGQVDGRENHAFKSMVFSKDYLLKFKDELGEYYDIILTAIKNHGSKEEMMEYPLFVHLLRFADKMDFSHERLEDNYKEKFGYFISEDITNVDFKYDDTFSLIITLNSDPLKLVNETRFFPKVFNALEMLAKKLGVEHRIIINGDDYTIDCNKTLNSYKK